MQDSALTTLAEQSGFAKTGRTDEVMRLCAALAQAWPGVVHNLEFGRSAEGRPMRALIASRADPRQVPLLMLQGGIHPGESDGKDAGFIALRELLGESAAPGVLERIAILFVPAFNVDGHERVGRWNRPNQAGPEETGWRTPPQKLNLHPDHHTESQSQPRLHQGGRARDAGDARTPPWLGPAGVRGPARHRRGGLPAGRLTAGRA